MPRTPKQPPELKLQSQAEDPVELTPLPITETIELTVRSTSRPIVGKPTVKNRVGKPRIGARDLVQTPAFGSARIITNDTPPDT
jgi:hypothetical protein